MTTDKTAKANESNQSESQSLSRRRLLKGAVSAAVGLTGISAIGEAEAACGCEGYYDDIGADCYYPPAPGWFGYLGMSDGDIHNFPWGTTNVVVFIHGFRTRRPNALKYGYEVWNKLRDSGYGGDSFSFLWDSKSQPWHWNQAKANANEAGIWLAEWMVNTGFISYGNFRIHFVCHSLGARVAMECLRHLHLGYNMNNAVDTVHLLGGAVHDRAIGGYYREDIETSCYELHNWHSANDKVLRIAFRGAEGGRWAVGWRGIASGPVPYNHYEHDHTFEINKHCQYMDYHTGVVDNIAAVPTFW